MITAMILPGNTSYYECMNYCTIAMGKYGGMWYLDGYPTNGRQIIRKA